MVASGGGQRAAAPQQVVQLGTQLDLAPPVDELVRDGDALQLLRARPPCHGSGMVLHT